MSNFDDKPDAVPNAVAVWSLEPPRSPGRPPVKQDQIVRILRQRILSGRLKPGHRVPVRTELERKFNASRATVQRAVEELMRDGFIISNGRQGTFVAPQPPHLHHYALLIPQDPRDRQLTDTPWAGSHFLIALAQQAEALQQGSTRRISVYRTSGRGDAGADFNRLLADIRAHRLAGLVTANPFGLRGTPLADPAVLKRLPVVGLGPPEALPGGISLGMPTMQMLDKALQWLAERGCKRLCVLSCSGFIHEELVAMRHRAAVFGLTLHDRWMHGGSAGWPVWAANVTELAFSLPPDERPDALFITDDTIAEHALAGLLRSPAQPGRDVTVVSHCNFPWPPFAVQPIKRIGPNVNAMMRLAIDLIDRRRRGQSVPDDVPLDAIFEEELSAEFRLPSTYLHSAT